MLEGQIMRSIGYWKGKRQWEVEELIWLDCILMASCRPSSRPAPPPVVATSSFPGERMEGGQARSPPQNIPVVKTHRQMGEWLASYFSVTPLVDPFERMSSSRQSSSLSQNFICCSHLAIIIRRVFRETEDQEAQARRSPGHGTLVPRRDPYAESLNISTVTNFANNATKKGLNMRKTLAHIRAATADKKVFVSEKLQNILLSAAFSFRSKMQLLMFTPA